jgi:hypothetical protein
LLSHSTCTAYTTQLLESRVLRVQYAASAAVALYSTNQSGLSALAHSGDVSGLFDSLVQSMVGAVQVCFVSQIQLLIHSAAALQVAFERQTLKPVFHFIGYRLWVLKAIGYGL